MYRVGSIRAFARGGADADADADVGADAWAGARVRLGAWERVRVRVRVRGMPARAHERARQTSRMISRPPMARAARRVGVELKLPLWGTWKPIANFLAIVNPCHAPTCANTDRIRGEIFKTPP